MGYLQVENATINRLAADRRWLGIAPVFRCFLRHLCGNRQRKTSTHLSIQIDNFADNL
jgi:hypothetical protein